MKKEKDYYKILGVGEKAGIDQIKKAYRKLAKKYHPDSHPGDKAAEAHFKEVAEAYHVLSDEKRRQEYDQFRKYGHLFQGANQGEKDSKWGYRDFSNFDLGNDPGIGDFFSQFFNSDFRGKEGFRARGQDVHADLRVPFEIAAYGGKQSVSIRINGQQKNLSVNIKAGTNDGQRIRLAGQGVTGAGTEPGDLILTVHIAKRTGFRRMGLDIIASVELNLAQALLGTKITVTTLEGKKVQVNVPAGTQNGSRLRLKGLGIKTPNGHGEYFLEFSVKLPARLSPEEQEIIKEFARRHRLRY